MSARTERVSCPSMIRRKHWNKFAVSCLLLLVAAACSNEPQRSVIDRLSLVTRHNVVVTKPDTLGSLSVGNGEFAFTVDVSGLQTFPGVYENGIPLGTQTQWAWHAFPNT